MIRRIASSLRNDTRGAIAPMVALASVALIGSMGIALDVGLYYTNNRSLQAATEAAALSAVAYPQLDAASAKNHAIAFLKSNGYPNIADASVTVEVGFYCADIDNKGDRFLVSNLPANCPGQTKIGGNAVRLHTTGQSHRYLTGILGGASPIPALRGTATAARIDEAGVQMTTGVIALDQALLVNKLLSLLAGYDIALAGLQIQALQGSNVDAGLMFDALAAAKGETGTYSDLMRRTDISLADLIAACQAGTTNATVKGALQVINGAGAGAIKVPLTKLFALGVWNKMPVGGANQKQSLRAGLNAYQLISYALQTNNRTANLASGLNLNLPGGSQVLLAASDSATMERPRFGFGPAHETTVSNSALRLQLNVKLTDLSGLLNGLGLSIVDQLALGPVKAILGGGVDVNLPVLIELAPGSAAISSISCGSEAANDAQVNVTANSGLLNAYLGTLPSDVMKQPFRPIVTTGLTPDLKTVSLINVNLLGLDLLKVDIRAKVGPIAGAVDKPLQFFQDARGNGIIGHPPSSGTAARVPNGSQLGPLLTGLAGNLDITATLLGIRITTGPLLTNVTNAVLVPLNTLVLSPLVDPLVDGLLGALGVQLGFVDTWVTGVRCGVPVLV
jgi:uncharacterized membrane protein